MNTQKDHFRLPNGVVIPSIGFGTWRVPDGKTAIESICHAVKTGYRHIDTAAAYDNETSVGKAIKECGVPRQELFITSKLWNASRGYDTTLKAFDKTMSDLGLDYLDLYLIHWPANKLQFGENARKINADTWKAFEKLFKEKRIRSIGLSNFLPHHLEELLADTEIVPSVDQIEYHPGYQQKETVEFCHNHHILVEAWAPLGAGQVLDDPVLLRLAGKYAKTVAQICLRWVLQHGILPLVKSVTPARIEENFRIFDFEIADEDMQEIDQLPYFGGSGLHPDKVEF